MDLMDLLNKLRVEKQILHEVQFQKLVARENLILPFEVFWPSHMKFIYSKKATKFCEIFTLLLTTVHTYSQK